MLVITNMRDHTCHHTPVITFPTLHSHHQVLRIITFPGYLRSDTLLAITSYSKSVRSYSTPPTMFSNVFGKNEEKTRSKKRADKSSNETDATQDTGYYTASGIEFSTVEEWIAGKDQFRVVAVGHARPFPMVRPASSNNNLVNYHNVHVAPQISPIPAVRI